MQMLEGKVDSYRLAGTTPQMNDLVYVQYGPEKGEREWYRGVVELVPKPVRINYMCVSFLCMCTPSHADTYT